MQFPGDAGFTEMFDNRGTPLFKAVTVDGAVTTMPTWTESMTIRRELAGDLPEDMSLVGGVVSASATLETDVANGAPHPLIAAQRQAWLGRRCTLAAGYVRAGNPTVQVFAGAVRELYADEGPRRGRLEMIDDRDSLRAPVTLPPFGSVANDKRFPQRVRNYPTNLSAVVVAALHASGLRVTPLPPAGAQFSAPMVGGMLADVGWTLPTGSGVPDGVDWLQPGYFATGNGTVPGAPMPKSIAGSPYDFTGFLATQPPATMHTIRFEGWVLPLAGSGRVDIARLDLGGTAVDVYWDSATNVFRADFDNTVNGGGVLAGPSRVTTAGQLHRVTVDYRFSDGRISLYVDQLAVAQALTTANPTYPGASLLVSCGIVQQVSMRTYDTGETAATPPLLTTQRVSTTLTSRVDRSALDVLTMPEITGVVGWDLIKDVAQAEFGMAGFNELGHWEFRNRAALNANVTSIATLGVDLVDKLTASAVLESVRTRVTAKTSQRWFISSGRGAETTSTTAVPSYIAQEILTIPVGLSEHLLTTQATFMPESSIVSTLSALGQAYDVDNGIMLCNEASGATRYTAATRTNFRATIHPVDSGTWKLVIVNTTGATRYAVWTANAVYNPGPFGLQPGGPGLWINGRAITDAGKREPRLIQAADLTSTPLWNVRTLDLGENQWRQNREQVAVLADQLLTDVRNPRPKVEDITIPPDLRWQVGDVVTLSDWRGRIPSFNARIVRLEYTLALDRENGMQAKASLRALP